MSPPVVRNELGLELHRSIILNRSAMRCIVTQCLDKWTSLSWTKCHVFQMVSRYSWCRYGLKGNGLELLVTEAYKSFVTVVCTIRCGRETLRERSCVMCREIYICVIYIMCMEIFISFYLCKYLFSRMSEPPMEKNAIPTSNLSFFSYFIFLFTHSRWLI